MQISRYASVLTVTIALLSAAAGALVAGDSRYVLTQVYAAEQRTVSAQLTQVQASILKGARQQIQSQMFQIQTKPKAERTRIEQERLHVLKNELSDVQREIEHAN